MPTLKPCRNRQLPMLRQTHSLDTCQMYNRIGFTRCTTELVSHGLASLASLIPSAYYLTPNPKVESTNGKYSSTPVDVHSR